MANKAAKNGNNGNDTPTQPETGTTTQATKEDTRIHVPDPELEDIVKQLRRPFSPEAVSFRVGGGGMVFAYIDARKAQERLDYVCPFDWHNVIVPGPVPDSFECQLTVHGVTRREVASLSAFKDDRAQATYSDAFKRAAVLFGVARSLYGLPKFEVRYRPQNGMLSDVAIKDLRDQYSKWLKTPAGQYWGEVLDHGDSPDAVVYPEGAVTDANANLFAELSLIDSVDRVMSIMTEKIESAPDEESLAQIGKALAAARELMREPEVLKKKYAARLILLRNSQRAAAAAAAGVATPAPGQSGPAPNQLDTDNMEDEQQRTVATWLARINRANDLGTLNAIGAELAALPTTHPARTTADVKTKWAAKKVMLQRAQQSSSASAPAAQASSDSPFNVGQSSEPAESAFDKTVNQIRGMIQAAVTEQALRGNVGAFIANHPDVRQLAPILQPEYDLKLQQLRAQNEVNNSSSEVDLNDVEVASAAGTLNLEEMPGYDDKIPF